MMLYDRNGAPVRTIGSWRDITAERRQRRPRRPGATRSSDRAVQSERHLRAHRPAVAHRCETRRGLCSSSTSTTSKA
ncbi:MAG: hypothetical protein ACLTMP_14910 [Eggerthella lenta]